MSNQKVRAGNITQEKDVLKKASLVVDADILHRDRLNSRNYVEASIKNLICIIERSETTQKGERYTKKPCSA